MPRILQMDEGETCQARAMFRAKHNAGPGAPWLGPTLPNVVGATSPPNPEQNGGSPVPFNTSTCCTWGRWAFRRPTFAATERLKAHVHKAPGTRKQASRKMSCFSSLVLSRTNDAGHLGHMPPVKVQNRPF
ncbi:hypothetical protein SORBI_3003G099232 [Sorghum bicolor]|uniref:Uncharacterized protein n=1 Tax=Sorghum bicolor TaxID=4558 RepID=A0A1B6Q2C8_SORBI|nr:hypothetical protein SORBI_3003G099232 [Sorghum bicolor]